MHLELSPIMLKCESFLELEFGGESSINTSELFISVSAILALYSSPL